MSTQPLTTPLVSVVIPSFNHAPYIREAIHSVIGQSLARWELVVVDDGSTDDSLEIVRTLAASDGRIRVFAQANAGAHAAINRGLSVCCGQYLTILNSDDRFHPERLARLVEAAGPAEDVLLATTVRAIGSNGAAVENTHPWPAFYQRLLRGYRAEGLARSLMLGNFTVSTSNFFFSRKLWERVGGFRSLRYNHDWDFLIRAVYDMPENFVFLDGEPLLDYRLHQHNTINQNTLKARLEMQGLHRSISRRTSPDTAYLVRAVRTNQRSIRRESLERQLGPHRQLLADLHRSHDTLKASNSDLARAHNQLLSEHAQLLQTLKRLEHALFELTKWPRWARTGAYAVHHAAAPDRVLAQNRYYRLGRAIARPVLFARVLLLRALKLLNFRDSP